MVSRGGAKRAHCKRIVTDEEEQPGKWAWLMGEAKLKEMVRFKRMKVYLVVTGESMERDEEGEMISVKWVCTNNGTEEHPIAKVPLVAREFNTGDKCGESSAGTLGLMAMRRVISGRVWNSVKHFLT